MAKNNLSIYQSIYIYGIITPDTYYVLFMENNECSYHAEMHTNRQHTWFVILTVFVLSFKQTNQAT